MGLPPHVWLLNLVTNFVRSVIASLAYIFGYAEATLRARMAAATTYTEWKSAARAIDNARGFLEWRASSDNRVYNHSEAARRIATLRNHMANGDVEMLVDDLQYDFHRAMCGLNNPLLFTQFPSGTKTNARELVSTIAKACKMIADDTNVAVDRKRNMLRHVSQAFGRSALVLDSSAAFGAYTVGVVKALHDVGALPYIIFGSGSGALVAAFACCDKNLSRLFNMEAIDFTAFQKRGQKGSATRKIKRLWNEGALMDISVLLQFAKDNIGELTFKEAFERTGRILNIAVSVYNADQRTRSIWLLNYLTAPDILIYTAACASCHAPLVYPRCDILQRMIDGSIVKCEPATLRWSCRMASLHVNDVIGRMRSLFGVNNFIVAEATLMRLPFLSFSRKHFVTGLLAFFSEELWRFLAAMSRIGFLQSRLTGVLQTACVPVTGDVVLHPVSTVGDMLRLISNPDQALLDYCIWRGEQKVWPHLERIRMCLTVENALREAEEKLARCCTGPPAVSPAAGFLGY